MTQQKLDLLLAWRETDLYTQREAARLATAEVGASALIDDDGRADLA
ncbi:hypothetical protein [Leucobacter tenebrionis]|nr:hypothetical protein [Leucobacter tenebrionis]QZY51407.1 hypothetical protein KVY00_12645 [Leucobacter tenebrionis]